MTNTEKLQSVKDDLAALEREKEPLLALVLSDDPQDPVAVKDAEAKLAAIAVREEALQHDARILESQSDQLPVDPGGDRYTLE